MIKESTPGGLKSYVIGINELSDLEKFTGKNIIILAKTLREIDPKIYDQLKKIKNEANQIAIVVSEKTAIQFGIISRDIPMLSIVFFSLFDAKVFFDEDQGSIKKPETN